MHNHDCRKMFVYQHNKRDNVSKTPVKSKIYSFLITKNNKLNNIAEYKPTNIDSKINFIIFYLYNQVNINYTNIIYLYIKNL